MKLISIKVILWKLKADKMQYGEGDLNHPSSFQQKRYCGRFQGKIGNGKDESFGYMGIYPFSIFYVLMLKQQSALSLGHRLPSRNIDCFNLINIKVTKWDT